MKKLAFGLSMFFLLVGSALKTDAQYYYFDKDYYDTDWIYELGGSAGIINCLTDLGGKKGKGKPMIKDLNPGNTQLGWSVFLGALYKNKIGIRLDYTNGNVNAYDSILKPVASNSSGRYQRNLSFRSKISEFSLIAEFHPLFIFIDWPSRDDEPTRWSPYILAGVGYFHFNPQARIGTKWVDLQPLHTEGQGFAEYPTRKEYKLNQINFPFGIGVKYELSGVWNVRAELVPRILTTDYLDDVSTKYINPNTFQNYLSGERLANALILNDRRAELVPLTVNINPKGGQKRGQSNNNDAYFTAMIKFSYTFGREKF